MDHSLALCRTIQMAHVFSRELTVNKMCFWYKLQYCQYCLDTKGYKNEFVKNCYK